MKTRLLAAFLCSSLFALAASAAGGFSQQAELRVKTHDHQFDRVKVESSDCNVRYQVFFDAPESAYPPGKTRHYQFHARIRFQSGKAVVSPIFGNPKPGKRFYEKTYDTTSEGCWAKDAQKLLALDVEACRGRGCVPAEFQ